MKETQISKTIYHKVMSIMKFTLNLEEYSYREKGREDARYRTFKQQLMSQTYDSLRSLFSELESAGIIVKTDDDEDVKQGFKESSSGGSGYVNSPEFDEWLKNQD